MAFADFVRNSMPRFDAATGAPILREHGLLFMHGGRLHPDSGHTDENGIEHDGMIGFAGPVLRGVVALRTTYGVHRIQFVDEAARITAQSATGWASSVFERSLDMAFSSDCLRIYNHGRDRYEYFSDWGIE